MAEEGHKVKLNVYDLTQGLARQLSSAFLGKPIEAVWHTGIDVYGIEYYFGAGIQQSPAGATPYGSPIRVLDLGTTHVPREVFEDYLIEISPRYTAETYHLLSHNCNNFTNEVAQFLVGVAIPDYILNLPNEVMTSPMGAFIMPMIQQLETTLRAGGVPQAPQFRPNTTSLGPSPSAVTNNNNDDDDDDDDDGDDDKATEKKEKEEKKEGKDGLGDARNKVQEEIMREFSAIMASGSIRASEAAALAARRVMERHGRLNVPMQQS